MLDEPRRHRRFLLLLGLAALATVPLPFVGHELVLLWGIPLWLWWSFLATASLSAVTAWGILHLWCDEDTQDDDTQDSDIQESDIQSKDSQDDEITTTKDVGLTADATEAEGAIHGHS